MMGYGSSVVIDFKNLDRWQVLLQFDDSTQLGKDLKTLGRKDENIVRSLET
jgi:hypothetical protein